MDLDKIKELKDKLDNGLITQEEFNTQKKIAIMDTKTYKVVPFVAAIERHGSSSQVASQLEELLNKEAAGGWQYERMESVETHIAAGKQKGCFGPETNDPKQPAYSDHFFVLVFSK